MDWNSLLTITSYYAVFATYTAHNHVIISTNNIHFRFADLEHFPKENPRFFRTFRLGNTRLPRITIDNYLSVMIQMGHYTGCLSTQ